MDRASVLRVLLSLASLLKLFGVEIPEEALNALADVIAGAIILWAVWKNNYLSKKGLKQKEVLEKNGLA